MEEEYLGLLEDIRVGIEYIEEHGHSLKCSKNIEDIDAREALRVAHDRIEYVCDLIRDCYGY